MPNRPLIVLAVLAALSALLLTACGDDDDDTAATGDETGAATATTPGTATATTGGETGSDAAIVVSQPRPGAVVTSPVTIAGTARVFEGTVQIRIRGVNGKELATTFTTASEGAPGRGDFSKRVKFSVPTEQGGVIEVFEQNVAEEGPPELNKVTVPVTLRP